MLLKVMAYLCFTRIPKKLPNKNGYVGMAVEKSPKGWPYSKHPDRQQCRDKSACSHYFFLIA